MKKVIYISGPMTGHENFNRFNFNHTALMLAQEDWGVLNPATLPDGLTETQYMTICQPMVMASTHIYMLKGWEKSKGAVAEHALAEKLGLIILCE